MKLPEVVSMGTLLVEIMRVKRDEPLDQSGTFTGPFPSRDTPIYIDAVARLDRPAGFMGAVGQDDFGRCLRNRFTRDGVDSSCGQILPDYTTGAAFVTYFSDGSRKFIYHCRHAAGQLNPTYVKAEYFKEAKWLNLTGVVSDEAGSFVVDGLNLSEAGRFANAVGALAVTWRGPMAGMPTRQESLDLIKS